MDEKKLIPLSEEELESVTGGITITMDDGSYLICANPACGGNDFSIEGTDGELKILQCTNCSSISKILLPSKYCF